MRCTDRPRKPWIPALLLAALFVAGTARADYVVSAGLEADTEDSRAATVIGSFATGEKSWLTGSLTKSRSDGPFFDLDTLYADIGFDHHFEPVGVRLGIGYWGDPDLLDSTNALAGLYIRGELGSVSLDFERRAFDLTLRSLLLDETRQVDFDADGIGLSARLKLNDSVSVYANGMSYDYSRDISIEPNTDRLRIFSLSRLSTINSLIDQRVSGGIEWSFGSRLLDLRASSFKTAVFGDRVDSIGLGFLTPMGATSDIEVRLSRDDSDTAGSITAFSVFLYFYGR